ARRPSVSLTWIRALPRHGRDHQAWPFPRAACEPAPRPHLVRMSTQPTHAQIEALVDRFYDRIQVHPTLGPVFNAAVDDWDEHKRLLVSFWTSVVLRAGPHRGNRWTARRPQRITPGHFVQWLELCRATADEMLAPEHAELLHDDAGRIGRSLRYGLGLPEPGETRSPFGPAVSLRGG